MYHHQSVSELRLQLENRGLGSSTKNKAALISMLEDDDEWQQSENSRYKVIVKNVSVMYSPCYKVYLEPTDQISKLKKILADLLYCSPENMVIYYNAGWEKVSPQPGDFVSPDERIIGKQTHDSCTFVDYMIHNEDMMFLSVTLDQVRVTKQ